MLKYGTVTKLDFKKGQVKVAFREEQGRDGGEKFEIWLPVLMQQTNGNAYFSMPRKGAQVLCELDESWEWGVVKGEIYTKGVTPKSSMTEHRTVIVFSDGTEIRYDTEAKELLIDAAKDITIKAAGKIKIEADTVEVKATTAKIEATTATIKASEGTATLMDTFTGMTNHLFVPNL